MKQTLKLALLGSTLAVFAFACDTSSSDDADMGIGGAGGGAGGAGGGAGGAGGGAGGAGGGAGGAGGGAGGAGGGGGGELSCGELNECLTNCGEDGACADACFNDASAEATELFTAAVECIQANGGDQAACQDEITACVGGGGPGPGGDGDCAGIFECAGACPQGDQACIQGCLAAATPDAQDQAIELSQCAQAADANGEDVEEACGDLIAACFGEPPPPGDLTCDEIFECANQCPAGDQACVQGCLQAGTAEAQDLAIETSQCVSEAEAAGQDPEMACAAQIEACFGPPAPPGDQACGQVLSCSAEALDADAAQACYDAGTEAARTLFEAVALCLNENMCVDLECPPCEAPIAACNADGQ